MKTKTLPNGAAGIVLTTDEVVKYCADAIAPQLAGVTLNRDQVQMVAERAPWLAHKLAETLEFNSGVACVLLSEQAQEHETIHECIHFGQIALSGSANDSTLLIDPSRIPLLSKDQWEASMALLTLVETFRPYFEETTPSDGYSFTVREYLMELVAHVLSGESLMAHVRGWVTPQDYEAECTLVESYRKVVQRDHTGEWHKTDIGIQFLTDLFQQFELGNIQPVHCKISESPLAV